jgi:biopolymer transport protein ExbD
MKTGIFPYICVLLVLSIFFFPETTVHGQRHSDLGKPAFVTNSNETQNAIYIPNQDRFHQFKIYKKEKNDNQYHLEATIDAPLSSNQTITPYSIIWIDEDANASTVSYCIEAYDHNGSKICDMKVIWQATKK